MTIAPPVRRKVVHTPTPSPTPPPTALAFTQKSTSDTSSFALKSTEETLAALSAPIDPRHFKTLTKGKGDKQVSLSFVPWGVIAKCLHARAPQWCFEITETKELAGSVVVVGRLSIPTTDGILHFSGVASEPIESASQAPPVESAASSCLRRAAALAGLGLDLYLN